MWKGTCIWTPETADAGIAPAKSGAIVRAGTAAFPPPRLAAIEASPRSYCVNVHTPTFPGGEIRGQLK